MTYISENGTYHNDTPGIGRTEPGHCAVGGGSLPVQSAEFLAAKWEAKAEAIDKERQCLDQQFAAITMRMIAKTTVLRDCASELRRHVEASNKRQPEENIKGET